MNEKDVKGVMKREEYEQISIPTLERVKIPLEKALVSTGVTIENIHSVELVGSGSRVPAIIKILTDFFGKEARHTMNTSECVAEGCALQCAMLSPTFRVREFQVKESFPFSIALSWKGYSLDAESGVVDNQQRTVVFTRGNPIPGMRALTLYGSGTFTLDVEYADVSESSGPANVSTYMIGPFQSTKGEMEKLKVKLRFNLHAIVSVESATLLEEEEIEVPVIKELTSEPTKMETDEAPPETDVNMQESKIDSSGAENGVLESGYPDPTSQMVTDSKVEPKKKVRKTNVLVTEVVHGGLTVMDLQKAAEKEFEIALQDRVIEETKDKKNALELMSMICGTRLQEVEDWLCEDGEDETKGVYISKLEELKMKSATRRIQ